MGGGGQSGNPNLQPIGEKKSLVDKKEIFAKHKSGFSKAKRKYEEKIIAKQKRKEEFSKRQEEKEEAIRKYKEKKALKMRAASNGRKNGALVGTNPTTMQG